MTLDLYDTTIIKLTRKKLTINLGGYNTLTTRTTIEQGIQGIRIHSERGRPWVHLLAYLLPEPWVNDNVAYYLKDDGAVTIDLETGHALDYEPPMVPTIDRKALSARKKEVKPFTDYCRGLIKLADTGVLPAMEQGASRRWYSRAKALPMNAWDIMASEDTDAWVTLLADCFPEHSMVQIMRKVRQAAVDKYGDDIMITKQARYGMHVNLNYDV